MRRFLIRSVSPRVFAIALAGVVLALSFIDALPASAGTISILNVDLNSYYTFGNQDISQYAVSPTTTATDANGLGFQPGLYPQYITYSGLNPIFTSGSVDVTFSGVAAVRDRGTELLSGPFQDLYRDTVAFWPDVAALTFSGLNPNTDYRFSFQSYDIAAGPIGLYGTRVTDVTPLGATNGATADAYYSTSSDPSFSITDFSSPSGGSGTFLVRSNASGVLAFSVGQISDDILEPRINGFELAVETSAVPEPSTLIMCLIGGVFGVGVLRKRFKRTSAA